MAQEILLRQDTRPRSSGETNKADRGAVFSMRPEESSPNAILMRCSSGARYSNKTALKR
jgi:hypothetical protein